LSCSGILAPLSFCCHKGKNGDHMRTLCIKFGRVSQNKLDLSYLAEVGTHNTTRPHTTHLPPLLSRRSPGNMSVSSPLPPLPLPCPQHQIFALSPTLAMAKCGTVLAADSLVANLVTSFNRRVRTTVRSWEEKEGERGVQKSDPPSLPPLGQERKGGPRDCNTGEG
jgi:hypothetical protein